MKFRSDNQIPYGQDHAFSRGIPSGVEFEVSHTRVSSGFKLVACGYGCREHGQCYGNGALYPWGLTARQRQRFEEAVEGKP